jgi:cysteine rich repeat protein
MMRQACGADFRRWCQGIALGGGRALACLADHRESLSEPCRDALAHVDGQ